MAMDKQTVERIDPVVDQNGFTPEDEQFFQLDRDTWVRVCSMSNNKHMYQKVIGGYPMPVLVMSDYAPDILTYKQWREAMEGKTWSQIVKENTPVVVKEHKDDEMALPFDLN
jgi:hypothetical protein